MEFIPAGSREKAPTSGGVDDAPREPGKLTLAERQLLTRRKRERRKREGTQVITTGRDEVVFSVAMFAARELLKMPEVRSRLANAALCQEALRAATYQGIRTAQGMSSQWAGLERLSSDLDGVLGDAGSIVRLIGDWPRTLERSESGWGVKGLASWTGRQGTESSLPTESIMGALRSIALRPKARAELNRERSAGLRGGRVRYQLGHTHVSGAAAHGAIRADELAAAEINERESRTGTYAITAKAIREYREGLRGVLAELD